MSGRTENAREYSWCRHMDHVERRSSTRLTFSVRTGLFFVNSDMIKALLISHIDSPKSSLMPSYTQTLELYYTKISAVTRAFIAGGVYINIFAFSHTNFF